MTEVEGFRSVKRMRYVPANRLMDVMDSTVTDRKSKPQLGVLHSVLMYLAGNCDNETLTIVRTQQRIAMETGFKERAVREALHWLDLMGMIDRTHRFDKNRRKRTSDTIWLRLFDEDVWEHWIDGSWTSQPVHDAGYIPAHDAGTSTKSFNDEQISSRDADSLRSSGATCGDTKTTDLIDQCLRNVSDDGLEATTATTEDEVETVTEGADVEFEQPEIVVGEVVATTTTVATVLTDTDKQVAEFHAWRERIAEKADMVLRPEKALTVNQRAKRLADVWYEIRKGAANHVAAQQIVKKIINSGLFDDKTILYALWEVRRASQSLTVESLMWELERENRERVRAMESKSRRQTETDGMFERMAARAMQGMEMQR